LEYRKSFIEIEIEIAIEIEPAQNLLFIGIETRFRGAVTVTRKRGVQRSGKLTKRNERLKQ
jgi:hypothetical protein